MLPAGWPTMFTFNLDTDGTHTNMLAIAFAWDDGSSSYLAPSQGYDQSIYDPVNGLPNADRFDCSITISNGTDIAQLETNLYPAGSSTFPEGLLQLTGDIDEQEGAFATLSTNGSYFSDVIFSPASPTGPDIPLASTTAVKSIKQGFMVSQNGQDYQEVDGPFHSVRGGWNKITILLLCLWFLHGCSPKNPPNERGGSWQGYIDNIENEVLEVSRQDTRGTILFNTSKLRPILTKQDNDIRSLEDQIIHKNNDLIQEHKENEWWGWHTRKLWHWFIGLSIVTVVGFVVISNYLPAGWIGIVWRGLTSLVVRRRNAA